MTITLPDELRPKLEEAARRRGLNTVEALIEQVSLESNDPHDGDEELIQLLRAGLESGASQALTPALIDELFERGMSKSAVRN